MTTILWYHRISNINNYLLFSNEYIVVVQNKTIVNTVYMKTIFDKIWYIV